MLHNAYPEKPILHYQKTKVELPKAVIALKEIEATPAVKHCAYPIFRNESRNGESGVNQNYCGFQADGQRWPGEYDKDIVGVVQTPENDTHKPRLFLAFDSVKSCLTMLLGRLQARGLFLGGTTVQADREQPLVVYTVHITTPEILAEQYYKTWVAGDPHAEMPKDKKEAFLSMYKQATQLFV